MVNLWWWANGGEQVYGVHSSWLSLSEFPITSPKTLVSVRWLVNIMSPYIHAYAPWSTIAEDNDVEQSS